MDGELTQGDEELYRQIHPDFVDSPEATGGAVVPTSQTFRPGENDGDAMSLDRSSITTAEQSHKRFIENGNRSIAVFSLTVEEFRQHDILCVGDPIEDNPAHAYADFREYPSENKRKKIGKRLKHLAMARGQCYLGIQSSDNGED